VTRADRAVLITGAGSGIGAATAERLAASGARVACVDVDAAGAQAVADRLGSHALPLVADVADRPSLTAAVATTLERFGRLDVCIANAGIGTGGALRHVDAPTVARHLQVNVLGAFNTVQACVAPLGDTHGYVLVVASLAAIVAPPGLGAYGASKAAVEALGAVWAAELAPLGIRVGVAYLSWVDTGLVTDAERDSPAFAAMRAGLPRPLRRTMPVDRAAATLVRAVDRRARRVFEPRALRAVSWARGLVGPLVERRLGRVAVAVDAASATEFDGRASGSPPLAGA